MGKKFILVLLTTVLTSLSGWAQNRSCSADLCVGDVVYNVDRDSARSRIISIEYDGDYVLQFLEGALSGQTGGNWGRNSLAVSRGCGRSYCVGDQAINTGRDYVRVSIVAVQTNGRYVVQFLEGALAYKNGAHWSDSELAQMHGCYDLCVGDVVYNLPRQAYATIVALQQDGRYVIRFTSGSLNGKTGGNWNRSDLVISNPTPNPHPPTDPNPPSPYPGPGPGRQWTCETRANGRLYTASAPTEGEAARIAVSRCNSGGGAPNQCQGNLSCRQR